MLIEVGREHLPAIPPGLGSFHLCISTVAQKPILGRIGSSSLGTLCRVIAELGGKFERI